MSAEAAILVVDRPRLDPRYFWLSALWVRGDARADDLYSAIALGDERDAKDESSDAYHSTMIALFLWEANGQIVHACPHAATLGCNAGFNHVFTPNYDDTITPDWLAHTWRRCPYCAERNALIAYVRPDLTLTCRLCKLSMPHREWASATKLSQSDYRKRTGTPVMPRPATTQIAPARPGLAKTAPTPTPATAARSLERPASSPTAQPDLFGARPNFQSQQALSKAGT